ncbi:MAG: DUF1292 domain-containing protein [Lachnospiraceae bacterium]|nr:DUF1292 domain-containing protein [Lachnospiraceae bacterium]
MEKDNMITIKGEEGEEIRLFILEETTIGGKNYIIATEDEDDEESEAYILRESENDPESGEIAYSFVEDDDEIAAVSGVFKELLDDCDLIVDD